MKKLFSLGRFFILNSKPQMALLVLLGCTSFGIVNFFGVTNWWTLQLDPIIGLVTFLVALFVWINEGRFAKEEKLPKRLTIRFLYEGQLVMVCKKASLTSKADIRAWGQQIGMQMNQNQRLKLNIVFTIKEGKRPKQDNTGAKYKPYYLECNLGELPFSPNSHGRKQLREDKYLLWTLDGQGNISETWPPQPDELPPLMQ